MKYSIEMTIRCDVVYVVTNDDQKGMKLRFNYSHGWILKDVNRKGCAFLELKSDPASSV